MTPIFPSVFVTVLAFATSQQTGDSGFYDNKVVPDVVSEAPAQTLTASWRSGVSAREGAELTPAQTAAAPQLSWRAQPGALYTVVMTDPDAPSRQRPLKREWRHWLVVDVPGTNVTDGDELTAYKGPGPPRGTGLHRYVLLVYKQPGKLTNVDPSLRQTKSQYNTRGGWRVADFASKHDLGTPVAGNLFQAQRQ